MKRMFLVCLSLLLILSLSCGAAALTAPLADIADKVIITDENWAYEHIDYYGYQIDSYIGTDSAPSIPWSFAKEYITSIAEYAFNGNTVISSMTLSGKITTIGDYAFNQCTNLSAVVLTDAVDTLGVGCFYGCSALTDINLEDTAVTAVPAYCFAESGVDKIALPESCTSIGSLAFYKCSSLSKIMIPDSVTEIATDAFMYCPGVVIYASADSAAIAYAQANNIEYVITDAQPITYILGDADGDGDITILDATRIQRVLAHLLDDPDGMITLRGDVYRDGLDIMDATAIQRFIAKLPTGENINKEFTV